MAFMVPETTQARAWHIDTKSEGTLPFFAQTPFDNKAEEELNDTKLEEWFGELLGYDPEDIYSVERDDKDGWYARLSASGYMDCTKWMGPYESEKEAIEALCAQYECDENGDDLAD